MRLISAKTILGLSALLLTAACTDELAENPADGARPIAFTPAAETRAAVDGTTLPGDFKVWGWYGESTGNIDKNVFNGTIIKAPSWTYDGFRGRRIISMGYIRKKYWHQLNQTAP